MAYNNGIFSRFTFTNSATNIFANLNAPAFNPPTGSVITNAHALSIAPTITPTGGSVTNAISLQVRSPTGGANNYSLLTTGSAPIGFGGTPTLSYFLIGATVSNTSTIYMMRNAGVYRSGTASNPAGFLEATAFNPPAGTVYGTAVGVQVSATRGGTGTVTNLWNMVVNQPTGGTSATISNVCAEFKGLTYHEGGVTFGAPGVGGYPNSGADILQYYIENASWTPTVGGSTTPGTGTYTSQTGYYNRIGGMVFLNATVVWTAIAGGAGSMQVQSLPFTVRNQTSYNPMTVPNVQDINGGGGFNYFGLMFVSNSRFANLVSIRSNNSNNAINLDTNGTIIFSGFYLIE